MPIHAVEPQRLYRRIAEQIVQLIRRGEYGPGDRLPPERELSKKLGVSRPVVREAMIALEIAGLVEVRGGAGAFVKNTRLGADRALAALPDQGPSPFDLIAARKMLEGEIAFMAATAIQPDDLKRLEQSIEEMRADIDAGRDSRPSDRVFHVRSRQIATEAAVTLGFRRARSFECIPLVHDCGEPGRIEVVFADPTQEAHVADVRAALGANLTLSVADRSDIVASIDASYPLSAQLPSLFDHLRDNRGV